MEDRRLTRILFVGQKPETVDFSDPSLPPGLDAEKIEAGIAVAVQNIEAREWQGDTCMITPDDAGLAMLEKALSRSAYDCVVIGGGLRIPPKGLALFEAVVNIIHRSEPGAPIAFKPGPKTRPRQPHGSCARPDLRPRETHRAAHHPLVRERLADHEALLFSRCGDRRDPRGIDCCPFSSRLA